MTTERAALYKTAVVKETGKYVAVRALGFKAFNAVTGEEENIFAVKETLDGPEIGHFYENALERFCF